MTGNANSPEIQWLVVALVGLIASLLETSLSVREVFIHFNDEGPTRGISRSSLLKSVLLLGAVALNMAVGLVALYTPEGVRPEIQHYQSVVAKALTASQLLTVLVIMTKDWERWYVAQWTWVPSRKEKGAAVGASCCHGETPEDV